MVAQSEMRISAAMVSLTAGLLFATFSAHAASGDSIGDARTIVSVVKADFEKQERGLSVGDSVRQNEVIEVSADGKGEFRLNDDTKLALGPSSDRSDSNQPSGKRTSCGARILTRAHHPRSVVAPSAPAPPATTHA